MATLHLGIIMGKGIITVTAIIIGIDLPVNSETSK